MTRDDTPDESPRGHERITSTRRTLLKQLGVGAAVLPVATGMTEAAFEKSLIFEDDFKYTDSPLNHGWRTDTSRDSPCRNIGTDGEFLTLDAGDSNHCNLYQRFSRSEETAVRVEMRARSLRDYRNGEGKVRILINTDDEPIASTEEAATLIFSDGSHPELLRVTTGGDTEATRTDAVDSNDWQHLVLWFDGDKTYAGTPSNQFLELDRSPDLSTDFRVYASNGSNVTEHDYVKVYRVEERVEVTIDVKPGEDPNPINPKSRGKIPVAIRHTDEFDPVDRVDVDSLRFGAPDLVEGGAGATPAHGGHAEDVDGDGRDDLVIHFPTEDTGFDGDEDTGRLEGETKDATPLFGEDSVKIVGGGHGKGGGPP